MLQDSSPNEVCYHDDANGHITLKSAEQLCSHVRKHRDSFSAGAALYAANF